MTAPAPVLREHGNAYNIFILVLTLFSLAVMVLLVLPLDEDTLTLLRVYDNAICVIFLGDFVYNLTGARPRRGYFIGQRGWLDLLGSIPSVGVFQLGALLRLARLSRLARIGKLLGGKNRKALVDGRAREPRASTPRSSPCWPPASCSASASLRHPPGGEPVARRQHHRPAAMPCGGAS